RTMPWAAMMFLQSAKLMTRGMARLRQILILAARVLAVATLIFGISRPLASGWLGVAGGAPDTTVVLLDRSASMEQQDLASGRSKRSTALEKVAGLIESTGSRTQIVLIESTGAPPQVVELAEALRDLPSTAASATAADIPAMMQAALDYITANKTGRTDVWVCSDLRRNDWRPGGGRWQGVRENFSRLEGVRFYLLTYERPAEDNVAVLVNGVHRRQVGDEAELVMDIRLRRESASRAPLRVPLQIVIGGVRSRFEVEMTDVEYVRQGHTIPIDRKLKRGWGRVELPNDSNPQDNIYHFVFAEPAMRHAVVVAEGGEVGELLRLAAATPAEPGVGHEVTLFSPGEAQEIDWAETSLLLWQAELPTGLLSRQIENFVAAGKSVVFLPPAGGGDNAIFGARWGAWGDVGRGPPLAVSDWRADEDLLTRDRSGEALPVGELHAFRYRGIEGAGLRPLAQLGGGPALLSRATTERGAVHFCGTWPRQSHSNFASNGVVFYVMVQRALARGAAALSGAQQLVAGSRTVAEAAGWKPQGDAARAVIPSERPVQAGVFEVDERLLAVNRPATEDMAAVIDAPALQQLLSGLDYTQVSDEVGNEDSLASEIWRAFLVLMVVALVVEAVLCLPERAKVPAGGALPFAGRSEQGAA
ncbi:MAG: hypothetical protein OER86_04420, partial [Phycisphaerae bacterium]|nr:hypothetical protein [Phycisphaerae bacterium]